MNSILDGYLKAKAERPDCVVLVRHGDYYKAFGEDADVLEKICGCVKTCPYDEPWMAHVFRWSVDSYVKELWEAGYTVILVDPAKERTNNG